jgi:hypothetical protein
MYNNRDIIVRLREQIPSFECVKGCHDCCGPVTTSSEEMSRLPVKSDAEHDDALNDLRCVYLGPDGCTVYEDRPLICRLFGTTPRMACPNDRRPEDMVTKKLSLMFITSLLIHGKYWYSLIGYNK